MDQNTTRDFVCKSPRCLVWETELPFRNVHRESPMFTYRGHTCYLKFYSQNAHFCLVLICGNESLEVEGATTHMRSLKSRASVVQNSDGKFLWCCSEKELLTKIEYFPSEEDWRFSIIFNRHAIGSEEPTRDKSVQTPPYMKACPCLQSLSKDLSKLLKEGSPHHDVKLKCGDHTLGAHSSILSARSEVIAKMLESDMTEGRTGVVEIQDMDCATLEHFLRYLYTGMLPELNLDIARGLYEVGDKYAIEELVRRCFDFLQENLTPDNACETLVLADAHSDQVFKDSVMTYILEKKIPLQDEYFSVLSAMNLQLAYEVLIRFCKFQANVQSAQDSETVTDGLKTDD